MFGFSPESVFTFIPESRSASPRKSVHLEPGIAFTLPRNTQELLLIPRGFLPTILFPLNFDSLPEDVSIREWTDVHPHAVVDVGVPANGLLGKWLPAGEEVVGRFAFENKLEAALQLLGVLERDVSSRLASVHCGLLTANPISEVGIGQLFQIGVGELVIVDQRAKPALVAVPDLPDEGAMLEERTVLIEKLVSKPIFQRLGFASLSLSGNGLIAPLCRSIRQVVREQGRAARLFYGWVGTKMDAI